MEVTWDPSAYNGIAGYRIYYSELALPADMDQWRTVDVGPYTVAVVPGLEPHSAYAVRVRAKSVVDARLSNFSDIAYTNRLNQGQCQWRSQTIRTVTSAERSRESLEAETLWKLHECNLHTISTTTTAAAAATTTIHHHHHHTITTTIIITITTTNNNKLLPPPPPPPPPPPTTTTTNYYYYYY